MPLYSIARLACAVAAALILVPVPGWAGAPASKLSGSELGGITAEQATSPEGQAAAWARLYPSSGSASTTLASCEELAEVRCETQEPIIVGFQHGVALAMLGLATRTQRILDRAFPDSCYRIEYRELARGDVATAVMNEHVDVGVLAVPPPMQAESVHRVSSILEDRDLAGVATVPVQPPSYSVVLEATSFTGAAAAAAPPAGAFWGTLLYIAHQALAVSMGPLGFAVIGGLCLSVSALLLNWRIPPPWLWRERGLNRLDSGLLSGTRVLRWALSTGKGRFFGLLWAAMGVGFYLSWPRAAATTAKKVQDSHLEGAQRAAYPGRSLQTYRNGEWMRCAEPHECLANVKTRISEALAGDRELLCHYAHAAGVGRLRFNAEGPAVPMLQAFLLPSVTEQSAAARLRRKLLVTAMSCEANEASPWASCEGESSALVRR